MVSFKHGEIFSEFGLFKPNLECNYTVPIYLTPNGIPFDAKSIRINESQLKFGLD